MADHLTDSNGSTASPRPLVSWLAALTFVCGIGFATPSYATPITLDGSWITVEEFMDVGDFFSAGGDGFWAWTSTAPVLLKITDWLVATDRFEVYHNGALFATLNGGQDWTTIPGCLDSNCHFTLNPDVAFADPAFASGSFLFAPGTHQIAIRDIHIPFKDSGRIYETGSVALSAEVVPEPGSLLLLGTGVGALVVRFRRRRSA